MSDHLNLDHAPLLTCCPFQKVCLSNVGSTSFMCPTSISTHMDDWKSFVKFGIKKLHEMISYNLSWIALLSEWNYRSSTKPCYLAQTTQIEIYNKSHEGFVLSGGQENTSIGLKLGFKLYRDATLTWFELYFRNFAWKCTLKQSCST